MNLQALLEAQAARLRWQIERQTAEGRADYPGPAASLEKILGDLEALPRLFDPSSPEAGE
ncbi:hypothetical protein FJ872_25770 [Mesorhizobium sp. B2-5-9]|uniref:hypothetical protein n=1 Tax=Mesorhizobium sp. B2-5-9 TaxID=2589921 RepID=UPI00112ABE60|nr:hypothetical protein [Mesorhizobium sp. B2-5-9]TPK05697.1 hypothetical protein FJ872_25770 [Mesorhizobium sp. B2-5-9]